MGYEQKMYFCFMKFLKQLFDFYINASIHVALSVYALVRITELYFKLPYNESLDYFIFYGTISGYNFIKYAGVAKLHHRSLTNQLKSIQVFSLFCFLAMCYYAWQLPLKTLIYCIPLELLTVLYAVPFLSGFQKNLRNISYLKIIIVALVWTGFTVVLPFLDAQKTIDSTVILYSVQRFLIVMVLILPFDIRDLKFDAISLQTIPQKIGVNNTKKLGFFLLLLSLTIEFYIMNNMAVKNAFFAFFILLLFFLMRAKKEQNKYYSSFWVEVLPVLWWALVFCILNFTP